MDTEQSDNIFSNEQFLKDKFKLFLNSLSSGICILKNDKTGTIVFANSYFYSILGYNYHEKEKFKLSSIKDIILENYFKVFLKMVEQCLLKKEYNFKYQVKAINKNKKTLWLSFECKYNFDNSDKMIFSVSNITHWKRIENQLHMLEEEQKIVMEQTKRPVIKYYIPTKTLVQPKMAADMFNLPCVCHNVPYSIADKIVAEESKKDYINFYESIIQGKPEGSTVIKIKAANSNKYNWYSCKYTIVNNQYGNPSQAVISYEDITELREKEIIYEKWRNYFESQRAESIACYEYDLTNDIFESLEGEISNRLPQKVRKSFSKVAEYAADNFIIQEERENYLNFFSRNKLLSEYYSGKRELKFEHIRKEANGNMFWACAIIQLVSEPYTNNIKASVLIKNIDKEKQNILKLKLLSSTDPLTGILNRTAVINKINEIFKESKQTDNHILLIIDLDNFKKLNDSNGHKFGDKVLCDVSNLLKFNIHTNDLCGRLGGDEFIVFLKNINLNHDLYKRLDNLCYILNKKYDKKIEISASIGISIYPKDGTDFEQLYEKADKALYQAKRNGRNKFTFYKY